MSGLTDEQKEKIKTDFREFSGGFHPGEAGEERERFQEEYGEHYGEEDLEEFLEEWGEEEFAKESEARKVKNAENAEAFKKNMQKLASSFVRMNNAKTAAILIMDDPSDPEKKLVFKLPDRETQTEAKAEAADLMWMVQLLLERGAVEVCKSGLATELADVKKLLKR